MTMAPLTSEQEELVERHLRVVAWTMKQMHHDSWHECLTDRYGSV